MLKKELTSISYPARVMEAGLSKPISTAINHRQRRQEKRRKQLFPYLRRLYLVRKDTLIHRIHKYAMSLPGDWLKVNSVHRISILRWRSIWTMRSRHALN